MGGFVKGVIGDPACHLVLFVLVFFHSFVCAVSEVAAGESPLATYDCRLPDARLGGGMVLKVFADARATLTIKGVVIAGERDPEAEYSYSEDGTTLKLSPKNNTARQMGAIRYSRPSDTLSFVGRNGSLNCSKG